MPTPSEEVYKVMAHESKNEINVIATISCVPPQLDSVKVGVFRNPSYTSKHTHVDGKCTELLEPTEFLLYSLDGIFIPRKSNYAKLTADDIEMFTEIRCPYFKKIPNPYVPERYMPQLQSGLFVTYSDKSWFVLYTNDVSFVSFVTRIKRFFFIMDK